MLVEFLITLALTGGANAGQQVFRRPLFPSAFDPLTHWGDTIDFYIDSDLGITIATGVSQWDDQSNQGHDITQATAAKQPAQISSCSPNGDRSCIRFDGGDDMMDSPTALNLTQPYTVFMAFSFPDVSSNRYMYESSGGSNPAYFRNVNPDFYIAAATALLLTTIDSNVHYAAFIYDGSSCEGFFEDTSLASGNCGSGSWDLITVGSRDGDSNHAQIDIMNLFVVDAVVTAAEITNVTGTGGFYETEFGPL